MRNHQQDELAFWGAKFGIKRQADLFFKLHPELEFVAIDPQIKLIQCPKCHEQTLESWIYSYDGKTYSHPLSRICRSCNEEKLSQDTKKSLLAKRRAVIDAEWYHIPESFQKEFSDIEDDTEVGKLLRRRGAEFANRVLTDKEKLNLQILGDTGTGKTLLSMTLAKGFKKRGLSVAFIKSVDLFDKIKKCFGNDYERARFDKQFESFDIVFIDDVGEEVKKASQTHWTASEWVKLIEMRAGKVTVFNANLDNDGFEKIVGKRAASRMSENCLFIQTFQADDYRKTKLKKDWGS